MSSSPSFFKKSIIGVLFFIFTVVWFSTLNTPILTSHFFRQAQTAQTAQVFVEEGFNFFHPKTRFFGKPGITALEFPIYQGMMGFLSKSTGVSLVTAGRFLSLLSALILVLSLTGILSLTLQKAPTTSPKTQSADPALVATVFTVLFSPLVMGISQWVSIELFNSAMGASALYFFISSLFGSGSRLKNVSYAILFLVCACVSLLLKPTVVVASLGLYAWACILSFKKNKVSKKLLLLVLLSLLSGAIAGLWHHWANLLNTAAKNPFALGGHLGWYFADFKNATISQGLVLAGRIFFYLIGPGTLLLIGYIKLFLKPTSQSTKSEKEKKAWIWAAGASAGFYLFLFPNLNLHHNYYQLPLILPVSILIGQFCLAHWPKPLKPGFISALLLVVILNTWVSQSRLMKNDIDLFKLVTYLQSQTEAGGNKIEIPVLAPNQALHAAIAFYIDRYVLPFEPSSELVAIRTTNPETIAVCDQSSNPNCENKVVSFWPNCYDHFLRFGQYSVCRPMAKPN